MYMKLIKWKDVEECRFKIGDGLRSSFSIRKVIYLRLQDCSYNSEYLFLMQNSILKCNKDWNNSPHFRLYSHTWNRKQIMSRFFIYGDDWRMKCSRGREKMGKILYMNEINKRQKNVKHEFICHLSGNLCSFHNSQFSYILILHLRVCRRLRRFSRLCTPSISISFIDYVTHIS